MAKRAWCVFLSTVLLVAHSSLAAGADETPLHQEGTSVDSQRQQTTPEATEEEIFTRVSLRNPVDIESFAESLETPSIRSRTQQVSSNQLFSLESVVDNQVGAFFYSGGYLPAELEKYAAFVERITGSPPQITSFVLSGEHIEANLQGFAENIDDVTVEDRSRDTVQEESATRNEAEVMHTGPDDYWQPDTFVSQFLDTSDYGFGYPDREFRTAIGWASDEDLSHYDFDGDQAAFEFNAKFDNPDVNLEGTRPWCDTDTYGNINAQFWGARAWNVDSSLLTTGIGAVYFQTDMPPAAEPYFDYADFSDPCDEIEFSWGVGIPSELEPNCSGASCLPGERYRYHVIIGTDAGTSDADQIWLSVQRADNNCPFTTESWCVGLQLNDPSVATSQITNNEANLTPLCIGGTLDRSKPADSDSSEFMYGTPDTWAQGTHRAGPNPGDWDDFIEHWCF